MTDFDVIITGSGPAGTTLASYLSKMNLKTLIFDKSVFPRDKVCGESISPGALNVLNEIGIKNEFESINVEKVLGVSFTTPDQSCATLYYPDKNYGYAISRRQLDKLLLDNARKQNGITSIEGFTLKNINIEKDKVIISGEKERQIKTFTGKILVGADGRYSTTAKLLNLYKQGIETGRHVYVATLENARELKNTLELEILNKKYQYIFSKQYGELASIGVVINDPKFNKRDMNKEEFIKLIHKSDSLRPRFDNVKFETQLKGICLQNYSLKSLVDNRVIFIGDTTGYIDPITGEGMYRAFKSAKYASETIFEAFAKDDFSKNSLMPYQQKLYNEFVSIYNFIKIAVLFTTNESISNFVIKNISSAEKLGEKIAALQGALAPGKDLFSGDTSKLLFSLFRSQLSQYVFGR